MPRNTTDEMYAFLSLTAEDVQQSVVLSALEDAMETVDALAPDDGTDRSTRLDFFRTKAERYFAGAEVLLHFANLFFMSQPPIRLLNVLNYGAGADSPTPTELLSALQKTSEIYRDQGFFWLSKCNPTTFAAKAGSV